MASNFKILVHQNGIDLHLQLLGDFDGSSAHQLLNILKKYGGNCARIFIQTDSLKRIIPFGRGVFLSNLHFLKGEPVHLVFTGKNASQLSP
ncbi:MAG: hypothetical protein JSW56_19695 [Deltaproteobacteria bacterium]|nr:MAG: hypothetical protein JSW56_19695 [Deltaproteobacteria bacterium]